MTCNLQIYNHTYKYEIENVKFPPLWQSFHTFTLESDIFISIRYLLFIKIFLVFRLYITDAFAHSPGALRHYVDSDNPA